MQAEAAPACYRSADGTLPLKEYLYSSHERTLRGSHLTKSRPRPHLVLMLTFPTLRNLFEWLTAFCGDEGHTDGELPHAIG
jgi:hypothetical protein